MGNVAEGCREMRYDWIDAGRWLCRVAPPEALKICTPERQGG